VAVRCMHVQVFDSTSAGPAAGSGLDALRDALGGSRSDRAAGRSAAGATDGRNAFREFMSTFGAVPVSAKNMHRLLQNKEAVLLFPGE